MTLDLAQFEHEYDLEALERIRPLGCDFEMLVTPRYLGRLVANQHEAFAGALIGAMSRSHRLFLDIGAHHGFFSLLAAAHNPEIEILALEPVPETHEVLARNFALNRLTRAKALRRAASDRAGRTRFNLSFSSDNCGFYPHPVAPPIGEIEVELVTVDQLLADREPCPTLVKIDTDGHELPVLQGMTETLARFPELKLLIELNPKMQRLAGHEPEELVAELGRLGFEVYLLDESARRAYRMGRPAAWRELMDHPESYVNLYCCRRETSLSVCFFSHSSALAGAERSLLELVTELVGDHGAICTVVLREEGPLEERLRAAGAATLLTSYPWWGELPEHLAKHERLSQDLVSRLAPAVDALLGDACPALERIDPDVIVTHTIAIPWGSLVAPILGKPHVWHICEFGDVDGGLRFLLPFSEVVEIIRESSRYVFTSSDAVREHFLPGAGEDLSCTLYRHIEVPEAGADRPPTGLFHRPDALRLALFGTYSPIKGHDLAVRAVGELVARGWDVELLLAGYRQDGFEQELRRLVRRLDLEDRVRFEGFLTDVYPAMRESDIVVIGSRTESFGRVAVEATLLAKPVVYPDIDGPAEYMENGVTGLSYPAGDALRMAGALERLLEDPDLRARLGLQARAFARSRFTREGYGGAAVQVLRRLRDAEPRAAPRWVHLLAAALADAGEANRRLREPAEALAPELRTLRDEARALAAELERVRDEHRALTGEARELRAAEQRMAGHLDSAEEQNRALRRELAEAQRVLDTTLGGATWALAVGLRRPLGLVAPVASRRRQLLKDLVGWSRWRLNRSR